MSILYKFFLCSPSLPSVDTKIEMQTLGIRKASNASNNSGRWSALKSKLNLVTATNHEVRKLDFVLVYQKKKDENSKAEKAKARKRNYFIRELRKEGLKIEFGNLAYMKINNEEDEDDEARDFRRILYTLVHRRE